MFPAGNLGRWVRPVVGRGIELRSDSSLFYSYLVVFPLNDSFFDPFLVSVAISIRKIHF